MNSAARLSSLTLAAVFTVAMLLGVNTLATTDTGAPRMAQSASTDHS